MGLLHRIAPWLEAGPLALVLVVFFGVPMLVVVGVSFMGLDRLDIVPSFTLENYTELLASNLALRLYLGSLKFAAVV